MKSEAEQHWTTAAAERRIVFQQSFGVQVSIGWIKAFQL